MRGGGGSSGGGDGLYHYQGLEVVIGLALHQISKGQENHRQKNTNLGTGKKDIPSRQGIAQTTTKSICIVNHLFVGFKRL